MTTFYSKRDDSGRLRKTRFSSSRFGVRLTACQNFYDLSLIFSIPKTSETLRGSPKKFFGSVTKQILYRK